MPFSRYPSGSCPCQVSLPFELRHFPAGSLSPLSRIEFVSYRLVVLLRLLPTPPHDDAVAVEYGPENVCPVGTFTLLFKCAYERTRRTLRGPIRSPRGGGSYSSPTRDIPGVGGPSVVRSDRRAEAAPTLRRPVAFPVWEDPPWSDQIAAPRRLPHSGFSVPNGVLESKKIQVAGAPWRRIETFG